MDNSTNHYKRWYNAVTLIIRIFRSFARASQYVLSLISFMYRFISYKVHPFWIQLFYFITVDLFGSLLLMVLKPSDPNFKPRYVDMFFLSTSSLTVSGLSTVEMEELSSSQIVVMTLLMLVGGDVFVSMLGVFFRSGKPSTVTAGLPISRVSSVNIDQIDETVASSVSTIDSRLESGTDISVNKESNDHNSNCLKCLGLIILAYWVLFHAAGFVACLVYISIISSSRQVLRGKGIGLGLFAFSTTVSSFANCGLIATNENMAVFSKNSGLLSFQVMLILAGNTLFPLFLRGTIQAVARFIRNDSVECMLKSPKEIKYGHLLTDVKAFFRSGTVFGLMGFMITLFCSMDWRRPVLEGLSPYQKLVNALFMAVNARHAGENSVDCSLISTAVLVLIIFMMYLPSSAAIMPVMVNKEDEEEMRCQENGNSGKTTATIVNMLMAPQVVCVILFVIVACIIERRRLISDPLNFSTLSVTFEVISAYGNVGLTTGYACSRLQKLQTRISCVDKPYSFSGSWSDEGKLLIVFVMLYGRLKTFSQRNGKAWTLRG